jgi:hypothetical protein
MEGTLPAGFLQKLGGFRTTETIGMWISFTQSGGFVGAVTGCRIDTAALDPADRRELEALVAASGLTESFERFSPSARDLRQYEVMIESDGKSVSVVCDDGSLPDAARPLVAFLVARARPQRPEA